MKHKQTITLIKQNERIDIHIDTLLSSNKSYGYTLRDDKNVNRVYYTSSSSKLVKVLNRLYNRKFINVWKTGDKMTNKEYKKSIKKKITFKLFKPKTKVELRKNQLYKITLLSV